MTKLSLLAAVLVLAACERQQAPAPAAKPPADQAQVQPQPAAPVPPVAQTPPPAAEPPEQQASDNWRDYANAEDKGRLRRLDAAWAKALEGVRKDGDEAEFAALGVLGDPKVALANPHPAPGAYRCRTIKLGRMGMIAYPYFRCEVELTPGGDLILRKLTGSQRTEGRFYPGGKRRLVYLGGQAWGMDETRATEYGADPMRDQIGVLERIGDQHWRLALPWPRVDSDLDLTELVK
jgi:hypothetical protein